MLSLALIYFSNCFHFAWIFHDNFIIVSLSVLIRSEFKEVNQSCVSVSGKPDLVNIDVSESIIPVKSGPKKINEEPIEIEASSKMF